MEMEKLEVKNRGVVFTINFDGTRYGRIKVKRTGIEIYKKSSSKCKKITWDKLFEL